MTWRNVSANEKTSYGGVSSFLRVSRLVFWFVATYGTKCCSITPDLIQTPSLQRFDGEEEFKLLNVIGAEHVWEKSRCIIIIIQRQSISSLQR